MRPRKPGPARDPRGARRYSKGIKGTATQTLPILHAHAAGIDVHSREHWVAVSPGSAPPRTNKEAGSSRLPAHVRHFGTCTADLEMLADWLKECGVTTIAMESTGVYWIPLFELLERRGFEVLLIDPRQTRQVAGRPKTDRLDCQWIQRLHSYGLLAPSFRPADEVVVLRSYLRHRQMLIQCAAQHIQHMQKALEQMNVKLAEVVTDITGKTGLAIIKDILAGERNPRRLAKHRDDRCKHTEAQIARALHGNWRDEHLFALQQALELYEVYQQKLDVCDARLETYLTSFADKSQGRTPPAPKPRRRKRQGNEPLFNVRGLLHRMSGVNLTVIEGIDDGTALTVLSEIGLDMSKWPSEKHFCSWLGLCPQHQASAGKIKSRHIRRGGNRAARALRMAAQGCHHAKNALGAFYRRIQARCGGPRAIIATARKIAERVYRLLKFGHEYVRQDMDAYEQVYRARLVHGLTRKARELGYRLEPATC
jgi:transposase